MSNIIEKHTPGPWRVGSYYRHEVVSDFGVICCGPIETEQSQANARLIAAAPEMLTALKEILNISSGIGKLESEDDQQWHDRIAEDLFDIDRTAKAVIKKVGG